MSGARNNGRPTARQRRVLALAKRYGTLMGMQAWDIVVEFKPYAYGGACVARDEYLQATLTFDLDRIPVGEEADFVRHELLHCLTWELVRVADRLAGKDKMAREAVRAANERCTTLLERMPVWKAKA